MYAKWNVNNRCNLRCSFCCVEDDHSREISLEDKYQILDMLYHGGVTAIDFFGKEPLFDNTIFRIMEYGELNKYNIEYTFITNGLKLLYYKDELFKSPCRNFSVSYDFGYARAFNIPLKDLRQFTDDFNVELSIDVHRGNIKTILDSLPNLVEVGVSSIYLKPILPKGSLSVNVDDPITEKEYEDFIRELISLTVKPYCRISIPFVFKTLTKNPFGYGYDYTIYTDPECTYADGIFIDSDSTMYGCGCACYALNKSYSAKLLDTPFTKALEIVRSYKGSERMCVKMYSQGGK